MERPGLWNCLFRTAKLRFYYSFLRFDTVVVRYGKHHFNLELADTKIKGQVGLSFRKEIGKADGIIFVYPKPTPTKIWMMNMNLDIDIIWLNSKGKVIYLIENARMSDSWHDFAIYQVKKKSSYAIELNSGDIKWNSIKLGGRFILPEMAYSS